MTAKLGPNALDLDVEQFRAPLRGRRGAIKPFLLNQKRIAGIGNVYVQDPLFKARIHPLRPINTLSDDEVTALWQALRETLQESIHRGGSAWRWSRSRWGARAATFVQRASGWRIAGSG